jgi:hypothetical protein
MVGDSYAGNAFGGNVGGMTLTRASGVVTVTGATSHPTYPGGFVTVVGCANLSDYAVDAPVLSWISSSSFTYQSAGPDGSIAAGAQSISILWKPVQQSAGFFSHLNRLSAGAYTLVAIGAIPGALMSTVAVAVSTLVTPYAPDRCIWLAGYNDINGGVSLAASVAAVVAAVNACPTAFWEIFSPGTFSSGAAADTAANLRQLQKYYRAYKSALAGYPNVRVHNTPAIIGASTGYSATGMTKISDKVHPSFLGYYTLAAYLVALDKLSPTGVDLPVTALDTYGNDALSKNLIDNPLMTGTGGAVTNVTGTFPSGVSGQLSGTGASGTSALNARTDGFGNDWTITYTPANADNNLRASISLTTSRIPAGSVIDQLVAKVSISGFGTSNAANLKGFQMALVWQTESGATTYASSVQECSQDAQTAAYTQQTDVTDVVVCLRNIPVPTWATNLSLARLDFTTSHYALSATPVVVKIGRVQVTLK